MRTTAVLLRLDTTARTSLKISMLVRNHLQQISEHHMEEESFQTLCCRVKQKEPKHTLLLGVFGNVHTSQCFVFVHLHFLSCCTQTRENSIQRCENNTNVTIVYIRCKQASLHAQVLTSHNFLLLLLLWLQRARIRKWRHVFVWVVDLTTFPKTLRSSTKNNFALSRNHVHQEAKDER